MAQWRSREPGGRGDRPRAGSVPDFGYNKLGSGELLSRALAEAAKILDSQKWEWQALAPVRSKRFGAEAHRLVISSPGGPGSRSYIVPLAAKSYTITRIGAPWYSVSESVIGASRQYGDNLVLCYFAETSSIRVARTETARQDEGYLRFGERYYGWAREDTIELESFLRTPELASYQARLAP